MKFEPRVNWQERIDQKATDRFVIDTIERNDRREVVLTVSCLYCGSQRTINGVTLRTGSAEKRIICRNCEHNRIIEEKQFEKEKRKREKELEKELERVAMLFQTSFPFCECGTILPFGMKVCKNCKRKNTRKREQRAEHKRRIREHVEFDKTITLDKLYERDHGVCYLCGKACDWSDFQKVNGAFVVGGSYPTVEHVKPLCRGGSHTWQNVKLACFACNTKKGRREMKDISLGLS